jgi:lysozyme
MRKINQEGLDKIKGFEGLRTKAYRDVANVITVGYGHTAAAGAPIPMMGMTITPADAEQILRNDLGQYERAVEEAVKVPLSDNQFAALVSFCFNVGPAAFRGSTLLKKLNAGNYDAVPGELAKWNKVSGKAVKGLVNRRAAEAGLWAKGEFVTGRTIHAAPAAPKVMTPENIAAGSGIVSSVATAASSPGPLQWAFAAVMVIGFAVAIWYFLIRRKEASA